jgi:hypothetical protein
MDKRVVAVGIGLLVLGSALVAIPLQTEPLASSDMSDGSSLNFTVPVSSELLPTPLYLNLSWGQNCPSGGGDVLHVECPAYGFTPLDCGQTGSAAAASCKEIAESSVAQAGSLEAQVTAGHSYTVLAQSPHPPSFPASPATPLSVRLTIPPFGSWLGVGILAAGVGTLLFGLRRVFPGRAAPPPPF